MCGCHGATFNGGDYMAKITKLKCIGECGKEMAMNSFYVSHSWLYKNNSGRMPICKECFYNEYRKLLIFYNDEVKALYHICMKLDIYYDKELINKSQENIANDELGLLKTYMKNVNSLRQYKGKCSVESTSHEILDVNAINEIEEKYIKEIEEFKNIEVEYKFESKKITKDIRRKWGNEYSEEECVLLEDYYDYYFNTYNHDNDPTKLDHIREVCTFKLIIAEAKRTKPINYQLIEKFHNLIRQTLNSAGLSPSQRRGAGESHDEIFGKKVYLYETERPIPEVQDELKDVDKFWKYILRYIIKPFAMVKGFAKGEYSIDEGDKVELNNELINHLGKEVIDNE